MRTDRVRAHRLLTSNVQAADVPSRSSAKLSRSTALRQLSQITLSHTVDIARVRFGSVAMVAVTSGRAPGAPARTGARVCAPGCRTRIRSLLETWAERIANDTAIEIFVIYVTAKLRMQTYKFLTQSGPVRPEPW